MPTSEPADASAVKRYLTELQDRITAAVEKIDSGQIQARCMGSGPRAAAARAAS